MASSITLRVIILYTIFYSIPAAKLMINEEMCDNEISKIRGLAILKDVNIWKDNRNTSLAKMLGQNLNQWSAYSGNLKLITDMAFTALCCLYSSVIVDFIQTAETDINKCNKLPDIHSIGSDKYMECLDAIKVQLKSLQVIAGQMLTTTFNYTKMFDLRANKNVLNAITSFYLFINGNENQTSTNDSNDSNKSKEPKKTDGSFVDKFFYMKLYTRYLIETFTVLNCSWEAMDGNLLKNVKQTKIESFFTSLTIKAQKSHCYDNKILYNFNLPETHYKQEHFEPKTLLLADVSAIRLGAYSESSLGYMAVIFQHSRISLREYYRSFAMDDYRSEIITKSQTIVFQSIALTIFYFIGRIINGSAEQRHAIDSDTETRVNEAIHILQTFNFPGLLRAKLRKVLYERTISPDSIKEAFRDIFTGSQFYSDEILGRFSQEQKTPQNVNELTEVLEKFTNELKVMESNVKTVVDINENLCDYEYEEVGFLQYDSSRFQLVGLSYEDGIVEVIPTLASLRENNCEFSYVAVVHFMLNVFIISQCEEIALDMKNMSKTKVLELCFNVMLESIMTIKDIADRTLVVTLSDLNSTSPHNNANRKLIDSILAMKLYFINDNRIISKVPPTLRGPINLNRVVSKLDTLKRYHRFIANLIEHYTVHNCSTPSAREFFTKAVNGTVKNRCSSVKDKKNKAPFIKCVYGFIEDNLKKYQTVKSKIVENDYYTVDKLLMIDILNKASNKSNGLSTLHDIKVMWEGDSKRLTEIVKFVKNSIDPKYLCKYQSIVIKAIFFIAYEKIKKIIQSRANNNLFVYYCDNKGTVLDALKLLSSNFFPIRIVQVYNMIVKYFEKYFQREASIDKNAFVRIIEMEQRYLGLQRESSDTIVDDIVLSIPDHTYERTSESPEVKTIETSRFEIDDDKSDGQENINELLKFFLDVEEVWTDVTNVAKMLDSKRMSDVDV